ncbi:MAG: glycosyl transferase [Actinomycetota bacterium]|nr:MAG: glycosyl transferase [Actinomycetota bacterium]
MVLEEPAVGGGGGALRAAGGVIWDPGRTAEVRRLIRRHRPDVVHVHNLFPALSPAVIRAARDEGVPVVMTLHNFRLLCLPATLLRDGRICGDCVGRFPWPGILHGCYRGSRAQSVPMAISLGLHRGIGTFDRVTRFIAVSDFVRRVHVGAGLPEDRVVVKPNFAWPAPRRGGPGGPYLYLGRLSAEKGVETLLRAWRPGLGRLVVAGDGPEGPRLRALAGEGVELIGAVPPERARELVAGREPCSCRRSATKGFPRVIVEAYASGVPVVASRIGALPEVVEEGVTGLLAEPGDPASWAEAVGRLREDELSLRLGEGAYRAWAERYTPERNLEMLEAIYAEAIAAARA